MKKLFQFVVPKFSQQQSLTIFSIRKVGTIPGSHFRFHRNGKPIEKPEDFPQRPPRYKITTGLVGVPVQKRWREMLLKLCDDVLNAVKEIPEGVYYRHVVENNFRYFGEVASNLEL